MPVALATNKVFTAQQEAHMEEYTIKIAKMFYGLPVTEFLKLAYNYAEACGCKNIPGIWVVNGMATRDWYYAFMSRHPKLALKTPEAISIARAKCFNRVSVGVFFDAYTEALSRYNFSADRIFNMDESGLSTVMKSNKVISERGRPVASQVARERGAHMTFVGFINAAGHYIPPCFLVARKRMKPEFLRGTLDGSIAIPGNGWMNGESFLQTLQHLHERSYCSVDNKILLVMDNAECHMNIHAVEYAMNNGIVIVTLPPHTTNKLQPLDVSIYKPFKTYLKTLMNDYILSNPNRPITEYMLPELASKAWVKACTPSNVLSGFSATGLWPVNREVFSDDAFAGAEVSERELAQDSQDSSSDGQEEQPLIFDLEARHSPPDTPLGPSPGPSSAPDTPIDPSPGPSSAPDTPIGPSPVPSSAPDTPIDPSPGPSSAPATPHHPAPRPSTTPQSSSSLTPDAVRPYPRDTVRPKPTGRKKIRACILTEDEDAIGMLREKEERKKVKEQKKLATPGKRKRGSGAASKPSKRRRVEDEESDADDPEPVLNDDSEYSEEEIVEAEPVESAEAYPFVEKEPEVRD